MGYLGARADTVAGAWGRRVIWGQGKIFCCMLLTTLSSMTCSAENTFSSQKVGLL